MHTRQKFILRKLMGEKGQRYSQLNRHFLPEDKFPYHLKYLIQSELVKKENGKYFLTPEGVKVTADFDTRNLEEIKPPNLLFLYICQFQDKFLVKEHFADDPKRRIYSLPFAKPIWGQSLKASAEMEFLRKYGFRASFKYKLTYHQVNRTSAESILFDNLWLVFEAVVKIKKDGCWLTKKELSSRPVHPMIKNLILHPTRKTFQEEFITLDYGL